MTVGSATAAMLREHMAKYPPLGSGLIFLGREKKPMARTTASEVWTTATAKMGLRRRTGWHDLRHHSASLLIAAGLSVVAVADRLGRQDSTETLRTYAHLWRDDEDRARAAIEGALWGSVAGDGAVSEPAGDKQDHLDVA